MLGRMFRMPKHQRFEYRPRHYDPVKEELNRRIQDKELIDYSDKDELRLRISEGIKRKRTYSKASKEGMLRSNILVALIAMILLLMSLLILNNIERFLQ